MNDTQNTSPKQVEPPWGHGDCWAYNRGEWSTLGADPLEAFLSPEEIKNDAYRWEEVAKRAGYHGRGGSAEEFEAIQVLEVQDRTPLTERFRYLIDVNLNYCYDTYIFVVDLPSLIELLPGLMSLRGAYRFQDFAELVTTAIERGFRAWHGHEVHGACHECDPGELQARRQHKKLFDEVVARKKAERTEAAK